MRRRFSIFTAEKQEGYFPIHRSELPRVITEDYPYTAEVYFQTENKFVKHYYSQLILDYFKDKVAVVDYNFVKDIEIWFKDSSQTTTLYQGYQKFTLKVHFSRLAKGKGSALLVSYDGISRASAKSLEELDWSTNGIGKVFCEGRTL